MIHLITVFPKKDGIFSEIYNLLVSSDYYTFNQFSIAKLILIGNNNFKNTTLKVQTEAGFFEMTVLLFFNLFWEDMATIKSIISGILWL
jgi:hypothetical protein